MPLNMNPRQLGAVLAGLRLLQEAKAAGTLDDNLAIASIATDGDSFEPLDDGEIDDLCGLLNIDDSKLPPVVTLQLTLTASFSDDEGEGSMSDQEIESEARKHLAHLVDHSLNHGLLTGESSLTADGVEHTIRRI